MCDYVFIAVHCPLLGMIDSGNITLKTDGKTSTALFSCMDGYEILGTTLIVCSDIGTWDSAEPVCGKYIIAQNCLPELFIENLT